MTTITPPGADVLPWDTGRCTHAPGTTCAGSRGCKIHPAALGEWHRGFADQLDGLVRAAKAATRRRGHRTPPIVRVLEVQARGALHVHLATPIEARSAAHELYRQIERLAPSYGFGSRCGWDPARGLDRADGRGLGAYISKLSGYVAKEAAGGGEGLREVLASVPGRRVFSVAPAITKETRCTMRNLRSLRYLHCRGWRDRLTDPSMLTCRNVEALMRCDRQEQQAEIAENRAAHAPPGWVAPWRDPLVVGLGAAGIDVVELRDVPARL
jgi:hypothetical protein